MDFSAQRFWWSETADVDDMLDTVLNNIITCARPNLMSFCIFVPARKAPEDAMERICQVVTSTSYPCLAILDVGLHSFGDWAILKKLPSTLRELFVGFLTREINLDDDLMFGHLCLDLPCLHICKLLLKSDADRPFWLAVSFALPCLEQIKIGRMGHSESPIEFVDWELDSLPDTCVVLCDETLSFRCNAMSQQVWTLVNTSDME